MRGASLELPDYGVDFAVHVLSLVRELDFLREMWGHRRMTSALEILPMNPRMALQKQVFARQLTVRGSNLPHFKRKTTVASCVEVVTVP